MKFLILLLPLVACDTHPNSYRFIGINAQGDTLIDHRGFACWIGLYQGEVSYDSSGFIRHIKLTVPNTALLKCDGYGY